jgi:hypothetical protein
MSTISILKLVAEIKSQVLDTSLDPGHGHSRLLQLVDELKLAVETPTETILRLIYQVCTHHYFGVSEKQIDLIKAS